MSNDSLLHNALGSATAGIISRIITHPLDTVKARIQATSTTSSSSSSPSSLSTPLHSKKAQLSPVGGKYNGPRHVLSQTFRTEGFRGLYRGFGAIVVGGTPGTMIYLCSYDIFKTRIGALMNSNSSKNDMGNNSHRSANTSLQLKNFSVHFISGMLAETVACIIYVPVDVIKERLQVQSLTLSNNETSHVNNNNNTQRYRGSWDALKKIMKSEGLSGVYKGYGATLASFGPFSAFYFVFYERFKTMAIDYQQQQQQQCSRRQQQDDDETSHTTNNNELSFPLLVSCSASAGALSSWITSPLDMAKLRLQIQRGGLTTSTSTSSGALSVTYRGMVDCLMVTYAQGGMRGLFKGAGARVMHFVPATTITMTCYEKCRAFYAKNFPI